MPIYEYVCSSCSHTLSKLQKFSDKPLVLCPECNKRTLSKKLSSAGFALKGTGWYVTDFKNPQKNREQNNLAASSPKSSPENKDSKTTEKSSSSSANNAAKEQPSSGKSS